MPAIKEFFRKIADVAYLKDQDFKDYIRLSRSVKYGVGIEDSASVGYYKITYEEQEDFTRN